MSQFEDFEFDEPLRDMAEDAIHRMYAIQEGNINGMHSHDIYRSDIFERGDSPKRVTADTVMAAEIVTGINPEIFKQGAPPDYFEAMLAKLAIVLCEHAYFRRRDGSTRIIPSVEAAKSEIFSKWISSFNERATNHDFNVFTAHMGSLGMTAVALNYSGSDSHWNLSYEAHSTAVHFLPDDTVEVTIVE